MYSDLRRKQRLEIRSSTLEVVKEYVYLGQVVSAEPNNEIEETGRIRMTWSKFGKYPQIITGR